jgi:hypothetical protein
MHQLSNQHMMNCFLQGSHDVTMSKGVSYAAYAEKLYIASVNGESE